MDNIANLVSAVKSFFEKEVLFSYSFDRWKDTLIADRSSDRNALLEMWGFQVDSLSFKSASADVQATQDDWAPCLSLEYDLTLNDMTVPLQLTIAKDQLVNVQVVDMRTVLTQFGEDFDFANAFERDCILRACQEFCV